MVSKLVKWAQFFARIFCRVLLVLCGTSIRVMFRFILFLLLHAFQGSNVLKESCFTCAKHSLCSGSQKSHECADLVIVAVRVFHKGAFSI